MLIFLIQFFIARICWLEDFQIWNIIQSSGNNDKSSLKLESFLPFFHVPTKIFSNSTFSELLCLVFHFCCLDVIKDRMYSITKVLDVNSQHRQDVNACRVKKIVDIIFFQF